MRKVRTFKARSNDMRRALLVDKSAPLAKALTCKRKSLLPRTARTSFSNPGLLASLSFVLAPSKGMLSARPAFNSIAAGAAGKGVAVVADAVIGGGVVDTAGGGGGAAVVFAARATGAFADGGGGGNVAAAVSVLTVGFGAADIFGGALAICGFAGFAMAVGAGAFFMGFFAMAGAGFAMAFLTASREAGWRSFTRVFGATCRIDVGAVRGGSLSCPEAAAETPPEKRPLSSITLRSTVTADCAAARDAEPIKTSAASPMAAAAAVPYRKP